MGNDGLLRRRLSRPPTVVRLSSQSTGYWSVMERTNERVDVTLPDDATAAVVARRTTKATLLRWRMPQFVDDATLVVSELVGNGLRHAFPPFLLGLERHRERLRVEVHDGSSALPRSITPDEGSESGRGMQIVRSLTETVDVREIEGDGKVVAVTLPAHPPRP